MFSRGNGHAAKILTPGPMMSGVRISGLARLGPRDEKDATNGNDGTAMTVPLNRIVFMCVSVKFIYALIFSPAAKLTCVAERTRVSAMVLKPSVSSFKSIVVASPAFFTSSLFGNSAYAPSYLTKDYFAFHIHT